ncbi:MAG: hypothetical protein QXI20_07340 [Candidatus Jordarchaeales archaeon]
MYVGGEILRYRLKEVKCPKCGYEFPKVLPVDCQKTSFLCVHCYWEEKGIKEAKKA